MMKKQTETNTHSRDERKAILDSWGFVPGPDGMYLIHKNAPGARFDFTATETEYFASEAIRIAFSSGTVQGANQLRTQINELLGTPRT